MKATILFCLSLLVICGSCSKKAETQSPAGSPYTKTMSGTRSFLKVASGYNPASKTYYSDSSNVSMDIVYKDNATVSFESQIYRYDSTTAAGEAWYHSTSASYIYSSHIVYNHNTNIVNVYQWRHVSAAGGDATTKYYQR